MNREVGLGVSLAIWGVGNKAAPCRNPKKKFTERICRPESARLVFQGRSRRLALPHLGLIGSKSLRQDRVGHVPFPSPVESPDWQLLALSGSYAGFPARTS